MAKRATWIVVPAACVLGFWLWHPVLLDDHCYAPNVKRFPSPDNIREARSYEQICEGDFQNATDRFWVTIGATESDSGSKIFEADGPPSVAWGSPTDLILVVKGVMAIRLSKHSADGITVHYQVPSDAAQKYLDTVNAIIDRQAAAARSNAGTFTNNRAKDEGIIVQMREMTTAASRTFTAWAADNVDK